MPIGKKEARVSSIFSKPLVRFLIFILIIVGLFLAGQYFAIDEAKINDFLKDIPYTLASGVFVLLYVAGTFIIWYLKDPLKLVGAILFGAYLSTLLIYIAELINAYIFFRLSRGLGKDFIEKSVKGRFKNFYEKLENINLGWVFLLRAIPLIPYRVLDISFGLTKMPFRRYLAVILLASLPRIFWIQFILAGVKGFSMDKMVAYFLDHRIIFIWSLLYAVFGLIVAIKMRIKFK